MKTITIEELLQLDQDTITVLDVRPADAYTRGSVPGAVSIPLAEVEERMEELPKEKDPNRIVPMTYSQRKERGDYRIFEPNEKEVNEKYYGRDMNMYLMKDINSNQKYINL